MAKRKHNRIRIAVSLPTWGKEALEQIAAGKLNGSVQLEGGLLLEEKLRELGYGPSTPHAEESHPSG